MCEYLLNVESELYGPYHDEAQARYARYLFASKHPDLAKSCEIVPIDRSLEYVPYYEPWLLQ